MSTFRRVRALAQAIALAGIAGLACSSALAADKNASSQPPAGQFSGEQIASLQSVWHLLAESDRAYFLKLGFDRSRATFTDELTDGEINYVLKAVSAATPGPVLRGPGPANDDCSNAELVSISSGQQVGVFGDNSLALDDPGQPFCNMDASRGTGTKGVWYRFIGTGNRVQIDVCSSAAVSDPVLRVFCGGCFGLTCISGDDDGCDGSFSLGPKLALCTTAGTEYHVLLSRFGTGAGGTFTLTFTDNGTNCSAAAVPCNTNPPANDECFNAAPLAIGGFVTGNTTNATLDTAPTCTGGSAPRNNVWYSLVGNGSAVNLSTCNAITGSNVKFAVYIGQCGALTCVAANDALGVSCFDRNDAAGLTFCTIPGTTYLISVSDEFNGSGLFRLVATDQGSCAAPPNDFCATASTINIGQTLTGNNAFATNDPAAGPTCNGLVTFNLGLWYTFTGNGNRLRATTCNSGTNFNTRVYVYSGSCGAFTCVGANATASPACSVRPDAATVEFCGLEGVTYYILVTNDTTGSGIFELSLTDLGPVGCVPSGACCTGGVCSVTTRALCEAGGGTYQGDNTSCEVYLLEPNTPIPDSPSPGITSVLNITATDVITDLDVGLLIRHTFQGDLRVILTHDNSGTSATLIDRPGVPQNSTVGFANDNFGNPTTRELFIPDDAATNGIYDSPPFGSVAVGGILSPTGRWQPETPLSVFNGLSINGTWTLSISDNAGIDTGTLLAWTLLPTPPGPPICGGGAGDCNNNGIPDAQEIGPLTDCYNPLAPTVNGRFVRGGADNTLDECQCIADWDRNGSLNSGDVSSYVTSWLEELAGAIPAGSANINCDGATNSGDVSAFLGLWLNGLATPGATGCP